MGIGDWGLGVGGLGVWGGAPNPPTHTQTHKPQILKKKNKKLKKKKK